MKSPFFRTFHIASGLAIALALPACGTGTYNAGMEPTHQPVVARTDYAIDLRTGGNGLDYGEEKRLAGWFQSLEIGYGDRVSVDAPDYDSAARDAVAAQANRYGILLADGAPVTAGSIPAGHVRVVVSRVTASVPGCPDWSRPSQPEYGNANMSNYGCATNSNLAAMIANPEDLIRGQSSSTSDPSTAAKAIRTFRTKPPTGAGALKSETTKGN